MRNNRNGYTPGKFPAALKALLMTLALAAPGCLITLGDFDSGGVSTLAVGTTSRRMADSLFGSPSSVETTGNSVTYSYAYSAQDPQPNTPVIDRKLLLLEFVEGTLNGFIYSNSVGATTTDFREDLRDSIAAGRTTKDQVRGLLGRPSGAALWPTNLFTSRSYSASYDTVPDGSREAWIYAYALTARSGGSSGYTDAFKRLVVWFDSAGTVTGSRYRTSGFWDSKSELAWCCPTDISYRLEKTSCVTIEIFDITGFPVEVLKNDEEETPGLYTSTPKLLGLPPGVFFVRMAFDDSVQTRRILLIR